MKRPGWNKYFKDIILLTAKRSTCKKHNVGCVLVINNRIISQGYNGHVSGAKHEQKLREGKELATIHAEQNVIADCAKRGVNCEGATAYITHYPCVHCMKLLCASGIKYIKYINKHKYDPLVKYFAKCSGIKITKI